MSKKKSNVLAIAIMFFLFAMISFVTGLQNPMGIIVKSQFEATNAMSQLGNLANFIAYAFMGLPAGFILKKYGYKVTSLAAVAVGFIGVGISFLSGVAESFAVYLTGAFVSGFSMCMLNTVVNPMLNTLGGGGNRGNQLIQFGGSLNSLSATIVPVLVGYLIGEVTADTAISDANPALFIAMGVFALAFVIILFSQIPEPELEAAKAAKQEEESTMTSVSKALMHKNLVFGVIAIFLYVLLGGKVSSKVMLTAVSSVAIVFLLVGMFLPETFVKFPAFSSNLSFSLVDIPLGVVFFVLCGLCTSIMWGAIFNLAVEGLGKYTSIASGLFMTMVCGGGILPFIQGAVSDIFGYVNSYWVLVVALAYLLVFALFLSKPSRDAAER